MLGIVTNRDLQKQLDLIASKEDVIMAALDDLQAADQVLKDEVAAFLADLADLAGQISGGVSAADAEAVVADINAQVAALKAADPAAPAG